MDRFHEQLKVEKWIQMAKSGLFSEWHSSFSPTDHPLHSALWEAEALAWQTSFPHLVFPELAREKINKAMSWQKHQGKVQSTSMMAFSA